MTAQQLTAAAAVAAAVIALATFVATVVLGRKNLQQARRGPDKAPQWCLSRPVREKDWVLLVNDPSAGTAYDVNIEPPNTPMFRAERHHDAIEPGGSVAMVLRFTGANGLADRTLTVHYRARPDGEVKTWTSAVP